MSRPSPGTSTNRWRVRLLAAALLCLPTVGLSADQLALGAADGETLWWRWPPGHPDSGPLPGTLTTPMGSLWKLFVFAYLVDTHQPEQRLRCDGRQAQEERYCCEPQESIGRDTALSRSCGLYFSPARLQLSAARWQAYWSRLGAPDWLQDLERLNEQQTLTVDSLLRALMLIPTPVRQQAKAALIGNSLQGRGREALPRLGTLAIVKTFTLPQDGIRTGGGSGWTQDDRPLWFSGSGNSQQVMRRMAANLARVLLARPSTDNSCVRVRFFARYPLQQMVDAAGQPLPMTPRRLDGHYELQFANGQRLAWQASGQPFWLERETDGTHAIWGRMPEEEYVARVLDREGNPGETQAALALGVAVRSYLQQQARFEGECRQIDDSSSLQRVSSLPATPAALAAARTTAGLQLKDVTVQYHQTRRGRNRLSWTQAIEWQAQGLDFVQILARAYPDARLVWQGAEAQPECQPLAEPARWLRQQLPQWRSTLAIIPGYEPIDLPQICLLQHGRPHADRQAQRLYLRPATTLEGRITLVHEYLHLALAHHPAGTDETYVEQLARKLVRGDL